MDLHTHIVPGVDDGASSMEEALNMADQAYREGIRVIIATPHFGMWNPDYDPVQAEEQCIQLKKEVRRHHPDMNLYMGNELFYSSGMLDALRQGRARTLGGTDYILVEFGVKTSWDDMHQAVRACVLDGFRPIIAHVERYRCLQKKLDLVEALAEDGALFQVNARSFLGGKLDAKTSWCRKLLDEELVHFIASDCHNAEARQPVMAQAVEKLLTFTNEKNVERIVKNNVIRMMQNKFL